MYLIINKTQKTATNENIEIHLLAQTVVMLNG